MKNSGACFAEHVAQCRPGIISLTGGGGKTSLLFALGKSLANRGLGVLCTTTTKMLCPGEDCGMPRALRNDPGQLTPPSEGALFAAHLPCPDAPGKVVGFSPEEVDAMHLRHPGSWIVVEADGAAGRPLKAPASHEPVIPSLTEIAVAMIGLGCMHRPLSPGNAFRLAELSAITGLAVGAAITPAAVARLVPHPNGLGKNIPVGAKRFLFCNQAELPGAEAAGRELIRELLDTCPECLHGVYLGSLRRNGLQCLYFPMT